MINDKTKKVVENIDALREQINKLKVTLFDAFKEALKETMELYKISSINLAVNNHEFNDGDATYFSVYYEDGLEFTFTNENGEEETTERYTNDKRDIVKKINDELEEVFSSFDKEDFYEDNFSDAYDRICFTIKNGKLNHSS